MPPRRRTSAQGNRAGSANAPGGSASPAPAAVYGPRSALTSFLREQGITGPGAQPQFRPRTGQRLDSQQAQDSTDVTLTADDAAAAAADGQEEQVTATASTGTSSDPTAANADAGPSTSRKRPAKDSAKSKAKHKGKGKPPAGDDDQDGFTLGGSPLDPPAPKKGRYEHRPVGSFAVCAECGKKFTVSKYTASAPKAAGVLCQPCTSESIEERAAFPGANAGKAAGAPKRPQPQKKKSQNRVDETLFTPVVTLQQACLAIVSRYIHSVDALGDLGPKNLDKVAKIVSKNRALDNDNLKLFLDVGMTELKLYDCTKLTDSALSSISTFAPHLHSLTLLQCGRLDDDVLDAWKDPLRGFRPGELRHVTLYAPYLVRADKWCEWFEALRGGKGGGASGAQGEEEEEREGEQDGAGQLETFQLRMSFRFDDRALETFVRHHSRVVHLQLSELGKLTSESLALLHPLAFPHGAPSPSSSADSEPEPEPILRSLDLSRLGTPQGHVLTDRALISLLSRVGPSLERLVLDGNVLLTERALTEGVRRYCHRLRELSLSDCEGVGGDGVEALMTGRWPGEEVEGGEDGAGEDGQEGAAADGQDGNAAATVTSPTTAGGASGSGEAAAHGEDVAMQDDPAEQDANGATTDAAAAPVDDAQDGPSEADLAAAPGTEANPSVAPPAAAENIADEAEEEEEDLPLFEPGQPWRSPGLTLLNLHRITTLHPSALNSLLAHSGPSLAHLNLHSCDELDGEALARLAREAKNLEVLDLSFVRAVDNFVVQDVLERMDKLRVLFLHGNNRVTSDVPRKRGVHLRGLENAVYTEIPGGIPWEW